MLGPSKYDIGRLAHNSDILEGGKKMYLHTPRIKARLGRGP